MSDLNEENQNNSEIQNIEELKEFLTNVCESMCLDAYESKPKDIPNFMIKYLQNKYGYSSSGLQHEEKKELEKLRNDVEIFREMDEHSYYAELQKQVKKEIKVNEKKSKNPPKPKPRLPPDEIIVSDDEDYNNIDEIDENLNDIEFIQKCSLNNKRIAVTENTLTNDDYQTPVKTFKKSNELIEFMRINLMKSPIFSELSMDILRQCIDAMEEKNIVALTDVVKQGEIDDNFFFIEEGELECKIQFIKITKEGNRKKVEKFEPKLVKVYGPGEYFGELSLLYHSPRRGTIKAMTDAKLYTLNRNTYKKIIKNANDDKILKKINIFKNVPILETLTDEELEKLEGISKEAIYYNGETIIKENEYSNIMFIIDKGRCIGTKTKEKGKIPEKVKDYREGDIIGEFALLKGEKGQENIIANSDIVKLICLDRFSFKNNFGSLEQILMRNLDIYNTFFPPIQEEKPEEIKEQNKEDMDKNLLSQNLNSSPQNNEPKSDQNNINVNNNINNNVNVEEIKKKIMEEVEEEKKKMEMKHEEEIERLKQQLAYLQNQNEELTKKNNLNIQNPENDLNNIKNEEINDNQQFQDKEQNNILYANNQNNISNNNQENNNNELPVDFNKENNIALNNNEENIENKNQNEQEVNNNMDIDNNDVKNDNNENINNLESNQNHQEMNKVTDEQNNMEEGSKNSSKLELIRDKLTYKENEIQKQNEEMQDNKQDFNMNQFVFNNPIEGNNDNNDIGNNNDMINNNVKENPEEEGFNENNQLNDGEF
jgi:cAMP-dependent protein kinase regulator